MEPPTDATILCFVARNGGQLKKDVLANARARLLSEFQSASFLMRSGTDFPRLMENDSLCIVIVNFPGEVDEVIDLMREFRLIRAQRKAA